MCEAGMKISAAHMDRYRARLVVHVPHYLRIETATEVTWLRLGSIL